MSSPTQIANYTHRPNRQFPFKLSFVASKPPGPRSGTVKLVGPQVNYILPGYNSDLVAYSDRINFALDEVESIESAALLCFNSMLKQSYDLTPDWALAYAHAYNGVCIAGLFEQIVHPHLNYYHPASWMTIYRIIDRLSIVDPNLGAAIRAMASAMYKPSSKL